MIVYVAIYDADEPYSASRVFQSFDAAQAYIISAAQRVRDDWEDDDVPIVTLDDALEYLGYNGMFGGIWEKEVE